MYGNSYNVKVRQVKYLRETENLRECYHIPGISYNVFTARLCEAERRIKERKRQYDSQISVLIYGTFPAHTFTRYNFQSRYLVRQQWVRRNA